MERSKTALERCLKSTRKQIKAAMFCLAIRIDNAKPYKSKDYERCYKAFGLKDWKGRTLDRITNGIEIKDVLTAIESAF